MAITNCSFVIIAKNEEERVHNSLDSLLRINMEDCEIILVDSNSTDNTLNIMKKYAKLFPIKPTILSCKGFLNAAIARNAGLSIANKKYCFFIDGDTEIYENFVKKALEIMDTDKNIVAVTGRLKEIYYSNNFTQILKKNKARIKIDKTKKIYLTGGNILVRTKSIKEIKGYKERYMINEDHKMALDLSRKGDIIALPIEMGCHHTLMFLERTWSFFWKGYPLYIGSLMKENLFRIKSLLAILKTNSGIFIGLFFYILILCFLISKLKIFLILIFIFLLSNFITCLLKKKNILNYFIIRLLYPILMILGFFIIPYPNKNKSTLIENIDY